MHLLHDVMGATSLGDTAHQIQRGVERHAGSTVGEPVSLSLRAQVDLRVTGTRYEPLGGVRPGKTNDAATPPVAEPDTP
jgi:hypothetical protein